METVLEIRIFFIIREMMIRNKPRIVRRIVEFFFFFSEISASISLIKNTRRGIPNSWAFVRSRPTRNYRVGIERRQSNMISEIFDGSVVAVARNAGTIARVSEIRDITASYVASFVELELDHIRGTESRASAAERSGADGSRWRRRLTTRRSRC